MTMRIYASTDGSAPVLTGQAGSLVALLDAVLVDGYGSATAAGWTKSFTASNQAVYRAPSGARYYLDVTDTNGGSTGSTRVAGFVTMSGVNTGTGRYPASGTNRSWVKSASTDSTARPWFIYADDSRFWLFVQAGIASFTTKWAAAFFGDIFAIDTSWADRSVLLVRDADWTGTLSNSCWTTSEMVFPSSGEWYAPAKAGGGAQFNSKPVASQFAINNGTGNSQTLGQYANGLAYPHTPSGGIVIQRLWWGHQTPQTLLGHIPGAWIGCHNNAGADGDTFTGAGALAGKSFKRYDLLNAGHIWIETSDTWD